MMPATVLPLPASHRSMARGRMAANEVRARGGDAMEAAVARIRATFDTASVHEDLKNRIRQVIAHGTGHPAVRARYDVRAVMLCGRSLDAAIFDVERWYCAERRAYQLASTYGFARGRLSLQVLAEMRVMLRLLRRSAYRHHFPAIVSLLLGECDDVTMGDAS